MAAGLLASDVPETSISSGVRIFGQLRGSLQITFLSWVEPKPHNQRTKGFNRWLEDIPDSAVLVSTGCGCGRLVLGRQNWDVSYVG